MTARTRHVVAWNKRLGRWAVTVNGESRSEHPTQQAAIQAAVAAARAGKPSDVIIKARNGRIRDNRTYGADPRSTRG